MSGYLHYKPGEALALTLRQLVIQYDTALVNEWDHTAMLCCMLHNLNVTVQNLVTRRKLRPKTLYDFHPFREKPNTLGLKITKKNFGILKLIGNALVSGK
jgi:hypothetical protein